MLTLPLKELRLRPHHSFSSLNKFLNICTLQYAFSYIYRLPPEHTPVNLVFGSAFHRTLEYLAKCRMQGSIVPNDDADECFSNYWSQLCLDAVDIAFKSQEQFEELEATGRRMIKVFMESWQEYEIIDICHAFSVPLGASDKPLIGEFDCILRDRDGKIVIVDWKSAARRWPEGKADKDLQATCFSYAYMLEYGEIPEFRFDVVTKTKTPVYQQLYTKRTSDDFVRLNRMVEMVERATAADAFHPSETSFACGDCIYKNACSAWHKQHQAA